MTLRKLQLDDDDDDNDDEQESRPYNVSSIRPSGEEVQETIPIVVNP